VVECHLAHGFRRIVLLNGHGGNSIPAQQALFELHQKYRQRSDLLLLLANYWALGEDSRNTIQGLSQAQMQHACQWETSMMLHAHPELVGALEALEPVDYGNPFQPAHRSGIMRDFTQSGHVGDPIIFPIQKKLRRNEKRPPSQREGRGPEIFREHKTACYYKSTLARKS